MLRYFIAALVIALPASVAAEPTPAEINPPIKARQVLDLRVQDDDTRALQQMKSSVCGTGPIYAGTVDNPILVKPLFHPRCTLTYPAPMSR